MPLGPTLVFLECTHLEGAWNEWSRVKDRSDLCHFAEFFSMAPFDLVHDLMRLLNKYICRLLNPSLYL